MSTSETSGRAGYVRRLAWLWLLPVIVGLAACGEEPTARPPATGQPATTNPSAAGTQPATATNPATATGNPPVAATSGPASTTPPANPTAANLPPQEQAVFQAILNDLTRRAVNIQPAGVQLLSITQQEFNDASLGCPDPDNLYAQVITPGYRVEVQANGQTFDFRTNLTGTRVVLCGPNRRPVPITP